MRAQMIRARAGEARDARDLRSLVFLVPFDGPSWVWKHEHAGGAGMRWAHGCALGGWMCWACADADARAC